MHDLKLHFLAKNNIQLDYVAFLAQDMSPRRYYRIANQNTLLMEGPVETLKRYTEVAAILNNMGAPAPKVFDQDGMYALIEDWGDDTVTQLIKRGSPAKPLFHQAIDVIVKLHKSCLQKPHVSHHFDTYDFESFLAEALIFLDWFEDKPIEGSAWADYEHIWQNLWNSCPITPSVIVLRDYHVDNIMQTPRGDLGLLDFQDALWGPCIYDLMSLLEDARFDISPDIEADCLAYYKAAMNIDDANWTQYLQAYRIWGVGRHLKILGVFTRYAKFHKNNSKLIHIPRVKSYIQRIVNSDPQFCELKNWLSQHTPSVFQNV